MEKLKEINDDEDILYMADLRKRPRAEQINEELTEAVKQYGFERRGNAGYVYKGKDPASALRNFSRIRPLVLDCGTALHWLTYVVLLELLGDEAFNIYIEKACDGELAIDRIVAPPLPSDSTIYYRSRHERHESPLPADLQDGDQLWIQGPADAYTWKITSPFNGHNVLVEKSETGEIFLEGFASAPDSPYRRLPYSGLRKFLLETSRSSLTFRDLLILQYQSVENPQGIAPQSSLPNEEAFEELRKNQSDALERALQFANDEEDLDLNQEAGLYPPESDSIRGVMAHIRVQESLPFHRLIEGGSRQYVLTRDPEIPAGGEFAAWIPGFEARLPHQRKLHAAAREFYDACFDAGGKKNRHFRGTILCGNADTEKTVACNALIERLEEEGFRIWKPGLNEREGEALLTHEEMQRFSAIPEEQEADAFYAELAEKFKPAWDGADVIFIDDAKRTLLINLGNAALRYARQAGKKILFNCDSDSMPAFHSSIERPTDWIAIRHIDEPVVGGRRIDTVKKNI